MHQQIFTAQFGTQTNKPRGFQGTHLLYIDIDYHKNYINSVRDENRDPVGAKNERRGELVSFGDVWRSQSRAQPACTHAPSRSFPGRVESQQKYRNRVNVGRLSFSIAIHPLIRQRFVEIYHCQWLEGTLSRWIGELWMRIAVSNVQFFPWCPLPSVIVALFCAAAIFNRLVLYSHPYRLTAVKAKKGWIS